MALIFAIHLWGSNDKENGSVGQSKLIGLCNIFGNLQLLKRKCFPQQPVKK